MVGGGNIFSVLTRMNFLYFFMHAWMFFCKMLNLTLVGFNILELSGLKEAAHCSRLSPVLGFPIIVFRYVQSRFMTHAS